MSFGYNSSGNAPPSPWMKIIAPDYRAPVEDGYGAPHPLHKILSTDKQSSIDQPTSDSGFEFAFPKEIDPLQMRIQITRELITKAETLPSLQQAAGRAAVMLAGELVVNFIAGTIN